MPSARSGADRVAATVDSVGPYALWKRRPPTAQRATSAGGQVSAPTVRTRRSGYSPSGTLASTEGGTSRQETRRSVRTRPSSSPASGPAGGTTRVPPEPKAMQSSATEMSKDGEPSCSTRSAAVSAKPSTRVAASAATPAWVTCTPLGTPVEPEVWMTYPAWAAYGSGPRSGSPA